MGSSPKRRPWVVVGVVVGYWWAVWMLAPSLTVTVPLAVFGGLIITIGAVTTLIKGT